MPPSLTDEQIAANREVYIAEHYRRTGYTPDQLDTIPAELREACLALERQQRAIRFYRDNPHIKPVRKRKPAQVAKPAQPKYASDGERADAIRASKRKWAATMRAAQRAAKPAKPVLTAAERADHIKASKRKWAATTRAVAHVKGQH